MNKEITVTEKTRLRRLSKRGVFDRETIYRILDEAFVCHVGFTVDALPFVIPTLYARANDELIIHGSSASRMMHSLADGVEVCVTVTLVDGLVLARSAFHHSMNYRSVIIFGKANLIADGAEKSEALRLFTEHIAPNRWAEVRQPTELELKATTVLRLPITEVSAKIRSGNPIDDAEDYALDVWAGVIPLKLTADKPVADEKLKAGTDIPDYLASYRRGSTI